MKILLTGAAGFLGSHLSNKLIENNHHVVGLDDLSTGSPKNIEHLLKNPNFEFIENDVRVPYEVNVDAILNFACPASPVAYQKDPVRTIETNFLGMINLLHLANKNGARVLQASTSEVYGDPLVSPQNESYWGNVNPIGIRSCYDEGKRAAETLCFDYKRQYGLDTSVIRIFNTYGPRMRLNDGRALPAFIGQALRGEDITVFGDGMQTRSFCYVDDLVEGIYRLLMSDYVQPVNLGNPDEITILDFAKEIIALTNSQQKIVFQPLPADDPKQRRPDISLAHEILGWKPTISRAEGLKSTYSCFLNLTPEELYHMEHKNFQQFIVK